MYLKCTYVLEYLCHHCREGASDDGAIWWRTVWWLKTVIICCFQLTLSFSIIFSTLYFKITTFVCWQWLHQVTYSIVMHCRYFFKKASDEFDSGVVLEEVVDDDDILPLWDGKIIAKVERKLWLCRIPCLMFMQLMGVGTGGAEGAAAPQTFGTGEQAIALAPPKVWAFCTTMLDWVEST